MNHKKLRRLYREERLQVRRRGGRKRALGTRAPMMMPQAPNQRWSLDFVSDSSPTAAASASWRWSTTSRGNAWRWSPIPRCPACASARELDAIIARRGRPTIDRLRQRHRADQHGDPALVAGDSRSTGTTSRPASRTQNAFIESFNGRLRDELLNETLFTSLAHAREALADWKDDYNTVRPHSAIGNLPPAIYAKLSDPAMQRDGSLRCLGAPRPVPLHHRACQAQMMFGLYIRLDEDQVDVQFWLDGQAADGR